LAEGERKEKKRKMKEGRDGEAKGEEN